MKSSVYTELLLISFPNLGLLRNMIDTGAFKGSPLNPAKEANRRRWHLHRRLSEPNPSEEFKALIRDIPGIKVELSSEIRIRFDQ